MTRLRVENWVWLPSGSGTFSPRHSIQNCSEAHQAYHPKSTGGSNPEIKATGSWICSFICI